MSRLTGSSLKANIIRLSRFLDSSEFELDNKLWRCHVKMVLKLLEEIGYFKNNRTLPINIDFTTKNDEFLILFAAIPFKGRAIPLYFSSRVYPKKAGMSDQKIMEQAHLRELSRLLPHENINPIIIADRGFGNVRFMKLCQEFKFNYIIRTKEDKYIKINNEKIKINSLEKKEYDFSKVKLMTEDYETRLIKTSGEDYENNWSIFTSLEKLSLKQVERRYYERFGIEKMFQDFKSSGFNIENSKIKNKCRFAKLLFCICQADTIQLFTGNWLEEAKEEEAIEIKKKYQLHIELISEFFK